MTDDKRTTRHKILGELESIKTLLDDHAENGSHGEDVPLLTEALNGVIHDIEESEKSAESEGSTDSDWLDLDQDEIPVLQAAVDEDEWREAEHQPSEEKSAHSEAERRSPDSASTSAVRPSTLESKQLTSKQLASEQSERSPSPDTHLPEDQPSLFDQDHENSVPAAIPDQHEDTKRPEAKPEDLAASRPLPRQAESPPADTVKGSPLTPPSKTENPFLPKHIRDRLHANRAKQQEMLDSFANSSHPPQQSSPADTKQSTSQNAKHSTDEQLVDEMLQLYLPRIEAELREKLHAIIEAERRAQEGKQEGP